MKSERKFDVYKGEWSEDLPNGKGILYHNSSGLITEGPFKEGVLDSHGNFKIRYPNGDVYEGSMLNHKKSGKGKLFYANGDLYEGEWVSNKREGAGKFYIKSEDMTIDGVFKNDEILRGKMTDKFGNFFLTLDDGSNPGRFVDGKLHGKVKIQYANGNQFVGFFADGKRSGQGRMIYTNIMLPSESLDDLVDFQRD